MTARDLAVRVEDGSGNAAPATGLIVSLDIAGSDALTCTVSGSTCTSGTATAAVSTGDRLVVTAHCTTASCTSSTNVVLFGWRVTATG